ncbi:MAG TPA: hypothetical protein VFO94_05650 [Gammaproteobacteria bacterium]|nr:hypothetical protein [Gammaproteobacteria bacterium]
MCVEQIHRAALVRYLRDHRITGELRDLTLREFYNVTDSRESALIEHRNYLVAASSQLCAAEILGLVDDRAGVGLLRQYELAYGQYFGMFCERARVLRSGGRYLLAPLLPEVREAAERIRLRILNGDLLRARVGPQRVGTLQHKPALRVEKSRPALRPSVPPKRAG